MLRYSASLWTRARAIVPVSPALQEKLLLRPAPRHHPTPCLASSRPLCLELNVCVHKAGVSSVPTQPGMPATPLPGRSGAKALRGNLSKPFRGHNPLAACQGSPVSLCRQDRGGGRPQEPRGPLRGAGGLTAARGPCSPGRARPPAPRPAPRPAAPSLTLRVSQPRPFFGGACCRGRAGQPCRECSEHPPFPRSAKATGTWSLASLRSGHVPSPPTRVGRGSTAFTAAGQSEELGQTRAEGGRCVRLGWQLGQAPCWSPSPPPIPPPCPLMLLVRSYSVHRFDVCISNLLG